ncbi:MBL fold metallo-hydrolase [Candidatus Fermentibacterales bacterium]|nr:MBL fold metallo-hydrolase [Candidatus Fermentibacterales bacterium]
MSAAHASSRVVLLGTGTPNAEPDRSGSCVAVVTGGSSYLVDFGPGSVRRAKAACAAGIAELCPQLLTTSFVTHLHSDHTAGLADLILTPWTLGRNVPLRIFGPEGLRDMAAHVLEAYSVDIEDRLGGLQPSNGRGWEVEVEEIRSAGRVYEDENVRVEAIEANHGSRKALGYRFETGDRSIAISGDTAPFDGWEESLRDCDLLLHEVYSAHGLSLMDPEWQAYHRAMHTSSEELALLAREVRPGLLVLYHHLLHGVPEEDLLGEIRTLYDGPVMIGKDLQILE